MSQQPPNNHAAAKANSEHKRRKHYLVRKEDVVTTEKVSGFWALALGLGAAAAFATAHNTTGIWLSTAAVSSGLLALAIYLWHMRFRKRRIAWWLVVPIFSAHAIFLVLAGAALFGASSKSVRLFHVTFNGGLDIASPISKTEGGPLILAHPGTQPGLTLEPIQQLLNFDITNVSAHDETIASFKLLRAQSKDGPWLTFCIPSIMGRRLFWIGLGPDRALEFSVSNSLEWGLRNPIAPGHTVTGWVIGFCPSESRSHCSAMFWKLILTTGAGATREYVMNEPRGARNGSISPLGGWTLTGIGTANLRGSTWNANPRCVE